jgi:hypothetical protein
VGILCRTVGESPRKRKAAGTQPAAPPPSQHPRLRSPPLTLHSGTLSNPPPGRRRGHSRQRSDLSSYRSSGRGRVENLGPLGRVSPGQWSVDSSSTRDDGGGETEQPARSGGGHSVSSLLSAEPPPQASLTSTGGPRQRERQDESGWQGEEQSRRTEITEEEHKGRDVTEPTGTRYTKPKEDIP